MPKTISPARPAASKSKAKFDIYKFLETRPLSFSALNSFTDPQWGSPENWYQSYIKGVRQDSPSLRFGTYVDEKFQKDPKFLPTIPRYEKFQNKMLAILEVGKKKIPLIGIEDQFQSKFINNRPSVRDLKTGKQGTYQWSQKKADTTEQLTFYALMHWLCEGVRPEAIDFYIDWVPTYERADLKIDFVKPIVPVTFKTKRTMAQVIALCSKIDKTLIAMEDYVNNHA
jgi:hypothetical protein